MLSDAKVSEVRRLLDEGLSQREAADRTGVSRGTVNRIATGKRTVRDEEEGPEEVPTYRCPECGVLVYLRPCQICALG